MAFENDVMDVSLITAADLSDYQYHFVKLSADNKVVLCANAADAPIGVLQNKPDGTVTEAVARVRVMGVSRVIVSADGAGAIAFGEHVGTDGVGHGVTKSLIKEIYLGIAIDSAAAGEPVSVLIQGALKTYNP